MTNKIRPTLAVLAASLLAMTSCTTVPFARTSNDLDSILETIPVGESRDVDITGTLQPYSGSIPKGRGLSEVAIGSRALLIHHYTEINNDLLASNLSKIVSARVTVSHFPLPDSHPASQIAGHWITEIKDLEPAE